MLHSGAPFVKLHNQKSTSVWVIQPKSYFLHVTHSFNFLIFSFTQKIQLASQITNLKNIQLRKLNIVIKPNIQLYKYKAKILVKYLPTKQIFSQQAKYQIKYLVTVLNIFFTTTVNIYVASYAFTKVNIYFETNYLVSKHNTSFG